MGVEDCFMGRPIFEVKIQSVACGTCITFFERDLIKDSGTAMGSGVVIERRE